MRSTPSVEPKWASRRWILDRYGLPVRAFQRAVVDGYVRNARFGSERQSSVRFLVRDVDNYVLAVAAGRSPKRVAGQVR